MNIERARARTIGDLREVDAGGLGRALTRSSTCTYLPREYVEASALLDAGRPLFLHAPSETVAFAAILREEPADVTTPVRLRRPASPQEGAELGGFWERYDAWCRERGVVTTFVRFHPLLGEPARCPPGSTSSPSATPSPGASTPDATCSPACTSTIAASCARPSARASPRRSQRPASLDEFVGPLRGDDAAERGRALLLLLRRVLGGARAARRRARASSTFAGRGARRERALPGGLAVAALPPRRLERRGPPAGSEQPAPARGRALGAGARLHALPPRRRRRRAGGLALRVQAPLRPPRSS